MGAASPPNPGRYDAVRSRLSFAAHDALAFPPLAPKASMNNEHPTEHALGNPAATVALVFDLDGTLVKTDVFLESALQLVGREPFGAFKLLGWVFLGKAELKRRVASRVPVDVADLRYERRLLTMGQQPRA